MRELRRVPLACGGREGKGREGRAAADLVGGEAISRARKLMIPSHGPCWVGRVRAETIFAVPNLGWTTSRPHPCNATDGTRLSEAIHFTPCDHSWKEKLAGGRSQVAAVINSMHERGSKTVRAAVYRVDVSPMHVECVHSGNKCTSTTVLPLARYGRIMWIRKPHPAQSLIRGFGRRIDAASVL